MPQRIGDGEVIKIRVRGSRAVVSLMAWWRSTSRRERRRRVAAIALASDRTGVTLRILVGWLTAEIAPHRMGGWLARTVGVPHLTIRLAWPGKPLAATGTVAVGSTVESTMGYPSRENRTRIPLRGLGNGNVRYDKSCPSTNTQR